MWSELLLTRRPSLEVREIPWIMESPCNERERGDLPTATRLHPSFMTHDGHRTKNHAIMINNAILSSNWRSLTSCNPRFYQDRTLFGGTLLVQIFGHMKEVHPLRVWFSRPHLSSFVGEIPWASHLHQNWCAYFLLQPAVHRSAIDLLSPELCIPCCSKGFKPGVSTIT